MPPPKKGSSTRKIKGGQPPPNGCSPPNPCPAGWRLPHAGTVCQRMVPRLLPRLCSAMLPLHSPAGTGSPGPQTSPVPVGPGLSPPDSPRRRTCGAPTGDRARSLQTQGWPLTVSALHDRQANLGWGVSLEHHETLTTRRLEKENPELYFSISKKRHRESRGSQSE